MTDKYIYVDENGTQYNCKNSAEHDRLWRDRYLTASGLQYQALVDAKTRIIPIQVHLGQYTDDNVSSNNTVTTKSVFLSVLVENVIIVLEDSGFKLEIEFKTESFKIPIDEYRSKPLKNVDELNVRWVGCTISNDDIWEPRNFDDDRPSKGINCQPMFQAFCTSASEFDPWESDNYRINVSIVLPSGQIIGDLDPEEPE